MKKKVWSVLLALVLLVVSMTPNAVHAGVEQGQCGDNLHWSLSNGTLTITGTGDMYNWCAYPDAEEDGKLPEGTFAPWYDMADQITRLVVGEGVTSIGDEALREAYSLTDIKLPESISYIGSYAFYGAGVNEVVLPDAVETVGTCAFAMCDYLESFQVSSHMTQISDGMVADCASLRDITIPENITRVGSGAFSNCYSLESLIIPNTVTEIGSYAFFRDFKLTDLTLTQSISKIEEYTFAGCGIKELTVPNGVTEIGKYAIADSAIETIVIPDTVDTIRAYGLCSPTNLREVIFLGHAPKTMYGFLFKDNVIKAYYPVNDSSWTAAKKGQYSGTVTWIPLECRDGHTYVETYMAPSFTEDGKREKTCSVCGDHTSEILPKLSKDLTITAQRGNPANKIRFAGKLEGYDRKSDYSAVVEHGILYITKTKLGAKTLTTTTSGRTKVSFTDYKEDGSFVYTLTATSAATKYVARAYMIVEDENGNKLTYYSPEVCVS